MPGTVFVTVGTTNFDDLIQAADSLSVSRVLSDKGFDRLVMQVGAGKHKPQCIVPPGQLRGVLADGLVVEWFDFAPDLSEYISSASLVISHAGAGSLFEALSLHKTVVAVPNPLLMGNHQEELANHLAAIRCCHTCTPATLEHTLRTLDSTKLAAYERTSPDGIIADIDHLMGFDTSN